MRQRLVFARALIDRPEMLFLSRPWPPPVSLTGHRLGAIVHGEEGGTMQDPALLQNVSYVVARRQEGYNVRARSKSLLVDLLATLETRYLLISFNDEGFIRPNEMREILDSLGSVEVMETQYNAFRGSRNFNNRSIHVTEQLFLVERR
jgi:hypothetical protein